MLVVWISSGSAAVRVSAIEEVGNTEVVLTIFRYKTCQGSKNIVQNVRSTPNPYVYMYTILFSKGWHIPLK